MTDLVESQTYKIVFKEHSVAWVCPVSTVLDEVKHCY